MEIIKTLLPYTQIVSSVFLITVILLQQRGEGLGSAFGGAGAGYYTKRGFERTLFIATIILSFLFIFSSILIIII